MQELTYRKACGRRFLVVEDETVTSIDLEGMLEDLGHTVSAVAQTREAAFRALERYSCQIDAAILDTDLAGQSSMPIANRLRCLGIPYSTVSSGSRRRDATKMGFRSVSAEKPYSTEKVADMISQLDRLCV